MANASGLASEYLIPGSFYHAPSKVEYQFSIVNGTAWMSYHRPGDIPLDGREHLEYTLGSGHLGFTYLYAKDDYWFETPVAYYAQTHGYNMKPGLGGIPYMETRRVDGRCLRCHMSDVQSADIGTENHFSGLPFLHVGITCESCHGDTREHVATKGKAALINLKTIDPAQRDSICLNCHLEGKSRVARRGKYALNFKPGERISDYLSYFVYASVSGLPRGVSEVEQFNQSQCKRVSGDAMSCMNCHDPHYTPGPAERVSFYRNKCLACHTQAKYATTHYANNPDCTSCHMPKRTANDIPHAGWTDHRILQHPDAAEPAGDKEETSQLVPVLPGDTGQRELGLAYYDVATQGDIGARQKAWEMLTNVHKSDANDVTVSLALGRLAQWAGKRSESANSYREVLKLDPNNLIAATNLGILLAQSGQIAAAETLWSPVFQRNEDIPELGLNLAYIECALEKPMRSREVLQQLLQYNPDEQRALELLKTINTGSNNCTAK